MKVFYATTNKYQFLILKANKWNRNQKLVSYVKYIVHPSFLTSIRLLRSSFLDYETIFIKRNLQIGTNYQLRNTDWLVFAIVVLYPTKSATLSIATDPCGTNILKWVSSRWWWRICCTRHTTRTANEPESSTRTKKEKLTKKDKQPIQEPSNAKNGSFGHL